MSTPPFLSGMTCLVTGGAQGLGWALARALAEAGGQVFLCDIDQGHLARAAVELQTLAQPPRIFMEHCDVGDRRQVLAWIERIRQTTGRIDVLVNNAVFMTWEPFAQASAENVARTLRVGLEGVLHTTQAVLPDMLRAGQGSIVNLGSVAGSMFLFTGYAGYAAVKAGVEAFTQMLQLECRDTGVHILLVRPGLIRGTALLQRHPPPRLPWLLDWLPIPTPDHVARVILEALRRKRRVITFPRYYRLLRLLYLLFPRLSQWLNRWGRARRRLAELTGHPADESDV